MSFEFSSNTFHTHNAVVLFLILSIYSLSQSTAAASTSDQTFTLHPKTRESVLNQIQTSLTNLKSLSLREDATSEFDETWCAFAEESLDFMKQFTELFLVQYGGDVRFTRFLATYFKTKQTSVVYIPTTQAYSELADSQVFSSFSFDGSNRGTKGGDENENVIVLKEYSAFNLDQLFRSTNMFTHQFVWKEFWNEVEIPNKETFNAILARILSLSRTTYVELPNSQTRPRPQQQQQPFVTNFFNWFEGRSIHEVVQQALAELSTEGGENGKRDTHYYSHTHHSHTSPFSSFSVLKPFHISDVSIKEIPSLSTSLFKIYKIDISSMVRNTQHHWAVKGSYYMTYTIEYNEHEVYPKLQKTSIRKDLSINYALNLNTILGWGATDPTLRKLFADVVMIPFYPDPEPNNFVFTGGRVMRIDDDEIHGPSNLQEPGVYLRLLCRRFYPKLQAEEAEEEEEGLERKFGAALTVAGGRTSRSSSVQARRCFEKFEACRSCSYVLGRQPCLDCIAFAACFRSLGENRPISNEATLPLSKCYRRTQVAVGGDVWENMKDRVEVPGLLRAEGTLTKEAREKQKASRYKFAGLRSPH